MLQLVVELQHWTLPVWLPKARISGRLFVFVVHCVIIDTLRGPVYYCPQQQLWKGNVFTPVSDSVWRGHAWQGVCMAGDVHGVGHERQGVGVMCGGGCVWQGGGICSAGMHGRGCAWQGGVHGGGGMCGREVCVAGRACLAGGPGREGCAWQERRPLQRIVRILLECILVDLY